MKAQSAYQRVVGSTRKEYDGGPRMPVNADYEEDDSRFAQVMRMVRAGRPRREIMRRFPEFSRCSDVLDVYQKIVDGTASDGSYDANKSTQSRTADAKRATVIAMMLNGHDMDEIARATGLDARTVYYYINGHSPSKKRRR